MDYRGKNILFTWCRYLALDRSTWINPAGSRHAASCKNDRDRCELCHPWTFHRSKLRVVRHSIFSFYTYSQPRCGSCASLYDVNCNFSFVVGTDYYERFRWVSLKGKDRRESGATWRRKAYCFAVYFDFHGDPWREKKLLYWGKLQLRESAKAVCSSLRRVFVEIAIRFGCYELDFNENLIETDIYRF